MHTVEFHLSLALIQALAPILPRLRHLGRDGRELAHELRASATAILRALASAALAAGPHVAARHRSRAHTLARHVHALLLTGHAWHYQMPGLRSEALMRAEHLAEYLAPVA